MLGLFILVQICHLENEGYRSALPSVGFPNSPTLIPSVMRHTFPRVSMVSCVHICYQTPSCVPLGDKNLCLLHVGIPSLVSRTQRGSTILPHLDFFICSYSDLWDASDFLRPASSQYWYPPEMCGLVVPHVEVLRRQNIFYRDFISPLPIVPSSYENKCLLNWTESLYTGEHVLKLFKLKKIDVVNVVQ